MEVSWSGTLCLLVLVLGGPAVYLAAYLVARVRRRKSGGEYATGNAHEVVPNALGEREKWTSTQYLFGLVGYAIGIGNVWRFCYVIARDGGAASLLAYMLSFVFIATPLFLYEMILGQYTRLSSLPAWIQVRPRWTGLGISQFLLCFIVQSYFVMVIAYTIPYIASSCVDPLPWADSSEEHWFVDILGLKQETEPGVLEDVEDKGDFQWVLVASYLLVWAVVYFSISFGKQVLSKITYVTVIAPVVLVVVLIARTAVLPGALDGIRFYLFKFESEKLKDPAVWAAALSQCLFSLSPGFGTAITMSSHTGDKEDVYKAAILTSCANTVFAVAAGFAVFAMIGSIAHVEGEAVEEVASRSGTGLAFIVIASAMPTFGAAGNVMGVLFFFMLFTLGLDSAFAWSETLTSTVEDMLVRQNWRKPPTWVTTLVITALCALAGLPYCTTHGSLILDSVDSFVGINFLLFICFLESVVFIWDFGYSRLDHALRKATGRDLFPKYGCKFGFYAAIPVATLALFIYQLYNDASNGVVPGYKSIEVAGWVLMGILVAVSCVTLWKTAQGTLPSMEPVVENEAAGAEAETDNIELIDRKSGSELGNSSSDHGTL